MLIADDHMPKIQRQDLEKAKSLCKAKKIIERFENDRVTFPDKQIYEKKNICKVLSEEYVPLICLAEKFCFVRNINLTSKAYQGPDGEIKFWWRKSLRVQIVCSNESHNRALEREQLSNGEIIFEHQNRKRDRATKKVVSNGHAFTTPSADFQRRLNRIVKAIKDKEQKYYTDTDTLIVKEDTAEFKHLEQLHSEVRKSIHNGGGSSYKSIYICYGKDIKRVK